jgi:hypothetical protein
MNPWQLGANPTRESGYEFFLSNMEHFRNRFREVKHQDLFWKTVIPAESVDTSINPGANMMSYPVSDWRGLGAFRARNARNIPTVSMVFDKNNVPIEVGGISAGMDTDELRAVQYGMRFDLRTKFPEIMRKACELHVEATFFFGDMNVCFLPFLDYPRIPATVAAQNAGGDTEWGNKTPDEILFDMNVALVTVWVNSRQKHMPNWMALPSGHYGYISSTARSSNSDTTILDYFLKNNLYTTSNNGASMTVVPLPYLDDAGVGGTARMIVGEKIADNFDMPFSLPFELLAPQFHGFSIDLFAEYKFGGVSMPYPMAYLFTDGI